MAAAAMAAVCLATAAVGLATAEGVKGSAPSLASVRLLQPADFQQFSQFVDNTVRPNRAN